MDQHTNLYQSLKERPNDTTLQKAIYLEALTSTALMIQKTIEIYPFGISCYGLKSPYRASVSIKLDESFMAAYYPWPGNVIKTIEVDSVFLNRQPVAIPEFSITADSCCGAYWLKMQLPNRGNYEVFGTVYEHEFGHPERKTLRLVFGEYFQVN